jgi:hypothetical protein
MVFDGRTYCNPLTGLSQVMLDEFERAMIEAIDHGWRDLQNIRLVGWCLRKAIAKEKGMEDNTPIPSLDNPLRLYACTLL